MTIYIKTFIRKNYKKFKANKAYQSLKAVPFLRKLKLFGGKAIWILRPYSYELHNDPFLQKIFQTVGKDLGITSIVETGTYYGTSTKFLAKMFPELPIYSSEIENKHYIKAKKNLKKYKNVHLYKGDSTDFLNKIIDKNLVGERPLIFLDAHWWDNWPLEKEIAIISKKLKSAVIIIDDFKVDGKTNFGYDVYHDKKTGKEKECSLEMVNPNLSKNKKYNLLFPDYVAEELPQKKYIPDLVGYPVIFQNMVNEFNKLKKNKFISRYFSDSSKLITLKKN